ncbi:hypothetical protein ONS95_007291 [Cadophora gregata]|uniref:uncharacterized protein n=1 Tax=Cadophora gregata TaxID=51156 RepID=UPI0026DC4D4D|nr:uncharacterized protein ONS95_007291 [Cadophora gregata]KAK0100844.1 hypothetical protein ONS95_007291 [Cadophora gregata]KAK0117164.1 hypothetical protein ONS96_012997 [Cadophora gregata f. sp. sojae]
MMSKPNAQYDWNTYMPKMVELYETGMSIPNIRAQILDPANGFKPSLSSLYSKFRDEGFPTKYTRASRLQPAKTSMGTATVAGNEYSRTLQVPTLCSTTNVQGALDFQNTYTHKGIDITSRYHPGFGDVQNQVPLNESSVSHGMDGMGVNTWDNGVRDSGPVATNYFHVPWSDTTLEDVFGAPEVNPDPWVAQAPYSTLNVPRSNPGSVALSEADTSRWSMDSDLDIGDKLGPSSKNNDYLSQMPTTNQKRQHPLDNTSLPDRSSKRNSSPVTESSTSRPVSWTKRGFNRSVSPDNRLSGSPRDSGYASGRSSLLVPIAEDTPPHPDSLKEFDGMHRVPCHDLHEPQPPSSTSSKNFATCGHCLFSGIHSLSWASRNMTAHEFREEIRSDHVDSSAVDAAGNTALHYAAAGGASYEHLSALIDIGVDPYRINTLGQLFLHYIVPSQELHVSLFSLEMVNFLNSLGSKGAVTALRWRDNEGKTVLDAIAAQMKDREGTTQIFQPVKDAFFPLEKPLQIGTHLQSQRPHWQQSKSGRDQDIATLNDFTMHQTRQDQAYKILGRASIEPSYVDPDTGDNILHALSRLRLPESGSLLEKIRDFVSKDIDLNVHNKERDSPLTAFIRERPFLGVESDETGATMSKYLDALLWKDTRRRVPNKINVNMKNREGATALYYAAVRARPDSVRSLIEAGANVNARITVDGQLISVLQATLNVKTKAVYAKNELKIHLFDNVISYLEHDGAVTDPTVMLERGLCENSITIMPK